MTLASCGVLSATASGVRQTQRLCVIVLATVMMKVVDAVLEQFSDGLYLCRVT